MLELAWASVLLYSDTHWDADTHRQYQYYIARLGTTPFAPASSAQLRAT